MPDRPSTWVEVSRSSARRAAEDRSLVLEAQGIPNGIGLAAGDYVVLVRAADAERARVELDRFDRENPAGSPPVAEMPPLGVSIAAAAVYVVILLALDVARRRGLLGADWWHAGAADAAAIRAGEWWRAITALGLHADAVHLAGNLAFGAAFGIMLAQSVGYGAAWLAFVVTGGLGNWLNAWAQRLPHVSIGASTAVFGVLGVQVAHDWLRRRQLHYNLFRRWAPLAIGAALLAWMGGDARSIDPNAFPARPGEIDVLLPNIDVTAHVLGFAIGVGLGLLLGWRRPRPPVGAPVQAVLAGLASCIWVLAWAVALK